MKIMFDRKIEAVGVIDWLRGTVFRQINILYKTRNSINISGERDLSLL